MKSTSMVGVVVFAGWTMGAAGACTNDGGNPPSTFEEPSSAPAPGGGGADEPGLPRGAARSATLGTFSSGEVMSIVEVLSLAEVEHGRVAQQHAVHPDVKAFASRMVEEHGRAIERVQRLAGAQQTADAPQVRVARDPTASVLQRHARLLTTDLESQRGTAFDLAYMTAQITEHAKALALIDHALLPSVAPRGTSPPSSTALGMHPAQASGAEQAGSGGAGGQEATGGTAPPIAPGALQTELRDLRGIVAHHLVEALRLQAALRAGAPIPASTRAILVPDVAPGNGR